ncbi:MAG: HAD-IIA family hydrolase [Fimbriimonadaceae bacterium]|nr:MAG: HAD-IIA family hydrolase [Fimbriimonadaceae bacterium]
MKLYSLYLLDLDGTVYRGNEPVPYARETLERLFTLGAKLRYITNNSAATREGVAQKLRAMGMPCEESWVYGSGQLAVRYAQDQGYKHVHTFAEPALEAAFWAAGIDPSAVEGAEAVFVGICRGITYEKLDDAARLVRGGVPFFATNADPTYPMPGGRLQPGSGAIVAAVERASGVSPRVLGKPAPDLLEWAMDETGVAPGEALVVGDRVDTDIDAGRAAGCDTFLVLTGVTERIPEGQAGAPDMRGLLP